MIYYTGDIHGSAKGIVAFAQHYELTESDIIVILGDVGANYYGNRRDRYCKDALARIKPTVFCIHGNHERRPDTLTGYKQKEWNGGLVWYEDEYPNLLFARDGDIFTMEGTRHLVIGGAYSVDKYYRLENDLLWFADEQPSAEIKTYVEDQITKNRIDIVLSHTCPYKYEPRDAFLAPMLSKEGFCKALQMIKEQESINEQFSKALDLVGNGHFVFGTENKYLLALRDVLKEAVNDQYDYIDWWLYEATDDYTVWEADCTMKYCLKEPEALYDYITGTLKPVPVSSGESTSQQE